ncbi:hypothetical protein CFC35_09420 [Streptomyces sp. FBKL.4005]|uniref:hypothetical protein n=1 Tax=Streptomyces sp. FBKL.4005 TaxID=2015515 RepID=UPI000B9738E8|nr:hypothetical protein [Streptomyces sp. FBKL.4005]OYP14717.1 hypothetical protein CFC35_09420 [Streptomyces sp. FBKL.4005]
MSPAGKSLTVAAAGLAAGAFAVMRRAKAHPSGTAAGDRWLTVTVNRAPHDVPADKLPAPLQAYRDRIETRIRPAPGDRGTELAVRLKETGPDTAHSLPARLAGTDPRQDLRRALREAKALLEAGEVLRPDTPPTTHDTPGGKLVGLLSRRAGGEGVL